MNLNPFKSEFLSNKEREAILDLPYDQAFEKFHQKLIKFTDKNPIKISREISQIETLNVIYLLFEVFVRVQRYNSIIFWNVQHITEFTEKYLSLGVTI